MKGKALRKLAEIIRVQISSLNAESKLRISMVEHLISRYDQKYPIFKYKSILNHDKQSNIK